MILYSIISPTLLKPEVWHELIRIVKINWFKWYNVFHKDVDIEAVACVHNLQYRSVQISTDTNVHATVLMEIQRLNWTIAGLPVDKPAVAEGRREESPRRLCCSTASGRYLRNTRYVHRGQHCRGTHRHVRQRCRPHSQQLRGVTHYQLSILNLSFLSRRWAVG